MQWVSLQRRAVAPSIRTKSGSVPVVALPQDVQLEKKSGIITRLNNKGLKGMTSRIRPAHTKKVNDRSGNCDTGAHRDKSMLQIDRNRRTTL